MGQAFRRAAGKIGGTGGVNLSPPSKSKTVVVRHPTGATASTSATAKIEEVAQVSSPNDLAGEQPRFNPDNVLEERDRSYDAMLSQMVGRIKSKPGGKAEMGEANVVGKYERPMPKARNTSPDTRRYEERPTLPGTLNVAQLRQIMLLYQGKAEDHNGRMDVHQIAEKFRVEVTQVEKIVQFVSLPPENSNEQKKHE